MSLITTEDFAAADHLRAAEAVGVGGDPLHLMLLPPQMAAIAHAARLLGALPPAIFRPS